MITPILRPHFSSYTIFGLSMELILSYQYNCELMDKMAGSQTDSIYSLEEAIVTFVDKQVEQNLWGSQKCHLS